MKIPAVTPTPVAPTPVARPSVASAAGSRAFRWPCRWLGLGLGLGLGAASLPACRTATTPASERPPAPSDSPAIGYPGPLHPPAAMGPDIQWQQRVTARWDARSQSFDAVLSKTDQELLLIGLSPMKTPGFIIRLADGDVEFENRSPRELPFDPRYIMLDVQRVYFPWIPGEPPADGRRDHRADGEQIVERWVAGRLQERRFRREDGRPAGEIVVTYEGWDGDRDAPRRAVLDNGWFGYKLEIETFAQQRI